MTFCADVSAPGGWRCISSLAQDLPPYMPPRRLAIRDIMTWQIPHQALGVCCNLYTSRQLLPVVPQKLSWISKAVPHLLSSNMGSNDRTAGRQEEQQPVRMSVFPCRICFVSADVRPNPASAARHDPSFLGVLALSVHCLIDWSNLLGSGLV
jgi:hypothetical protein